MRELYPEARDGVDPFERYAADDRTPPGGLTPWVTVNMIATADGATAIDGRSGGIGGPADKVVFQAIRAVADVVLVGAATVRAESYGPPAAAPGRTRPPRLAIVTRSLDLEDASRLFTEADPDARPIVVTVERADATRRARLGRVADVVVAGDDHVEIPAALQLLRSLGATVVVCEGGPSLNGQLVASDAIDELCLTVSPLLAGGRSARLAHGDPPPLARRLRLDRVLNDDGLLFLRYLRR